MIKPKIMIEGSVENWVTTRDENNKEEEINKEEVEKRENIKKIYNDLFERDLFPVKILQGGKVIDLVADVNIYGVEHKRPFVVLEAAEIGGGKNSEDGESGKVIYKREVKEKGAFQSIEKEAVIYRHILPEL